LARWTRPRTIAAASAAALVLLGLSFGSRLLGIGARASVQPTQGHAFLNGQAIPGATLLFDPIDPKGVTFPRPHGVVKDDGSFTVGTYKDDDGAPAGDYRVLIQWFVTDARADSEAS